MVHIKRIELSNFKSFGRTTSIPFLPGFTVVSGPNGSGKSNILDALLFCLGLATSKGLRAERLPDLINISTNNRSNQEAYVSVTFDISDYFNSEKLLDITQQQDNLVHKNEWKVTRRLRVTKGGSYSSNYYINERPCNVNELHEELNRFRIYPEGYNVVLQGDVTSIISMNSRERRVIIDELAGVAEFDRKINKTKETLEEVKDREERCKILQIELENSLKRLTADRTKAEKYQKLKQEISKKKEWEMVLLWKSLLKKISNIEIQKLNDEETANKLINNSLYLKTRLSKINIDLENLNLQVKALGEDERLTIASKLSTKKAQVNQLQQQKKEFFCIIEKIKREENKITTTILQKKEELDGLSQNSNKLQQELLPLLKEQKLRSYQTLQMVRKQAAIIAETSDSWIREQANLSIETSSLQNKLNPQLEQKAKLTERYQQVSSILNKEEEQLRKYEKDIYLQNKELEKLSISYIEEVQIISKTLDIEKQDYSIIKETQLRLNKEYRDKQRHLDRLEASRQAKQEIQGTYASQFILNSDLSGVCGLVAELGQVAPHHQLALEIAAGSRLGHIVVEDNTIAIAGINILKQAKAGRATFLPLTKIRFYSKQSNYYLKNAPGFIGLAVDLVICNPAYKKVFSYIFSNTAVFETIDYAKKYLGKQRIVTLDGDLLEVSGAMTGGSKPQRSSIRFGVLNQGEPEEIKIFRQRLVDIENLVLRNEENIQIKIKQIKDLSDKLIKTEQLSREQQLKYQQVRNEIERLKNYKKDLEFKISNHQQEIKTLKNELTDIHKISSVLEIELLEKHKQLKNIEKSHSHSEWKEVQILIKDQENHLQDREIELRQGEEKFQKIRNQITSIEHKIHEDELKIKLSEQHTVDINNQQVDIENKLQKFDVEVENLEVSLEKLTQTLDDTKTKRDCLEEKVKILEKEYQSHVWTLEKLETRQKEREEALSILEKEEEIAKLKLPVSFPEIPLLSELNESLESLSSHTDKLQKEMYKKQKYLESMEPVNMLALEEYEKVQKRLRELTNKLITIQEERTELLLRIENFTTVRLRSFKVSFDAVNDNFKKIFSTLSQGDGYLQLDDEKDPFKGGLNLVAHPKGKPVQRLNSMSGGEKSLTALSFIFSLQQYRPSPFYAFDEVDMFLDGANVERLSQMIQKQTEKAQFIVVSLRRPMIEASQRTIGVTQARGAHTQVLGIKL
ncbi:MAG: condensin subunit Smc [Candidatus Atelocyanobacterium thalassa isolate SIO64986]|uniref:Chromosome partition protein Smc n=1 Tax=Candidatus Atelocyanobacterium thalassa isolate SIO64986 TaxID=1527444 RepID=A0A086CI88_9CHRO|nr:MAG: condensin subunit Smc [Candidatus Atelocyanobacterium thalassa isolate SIO64986]